MDPIYETKVTEIPHTIRTRRPPLVHFEVTSHMNLALSEILNLQEDLGYSPVTHADPMNVRRGLDGVGMWLIQWDTEERS